MFLAQFEDKAAETRSVTCELFRLSIQPGFTFQEPE